MEFIIRSGRAVIYPIYIGTLIRTLPPPVSAIDLKDRRLKKFQDLHQAVEYLVSRGDIDGSKLAYLGATVSLEERFRTAVLFEGGLYLSPAGPPETDALNFLPRVRVPIWLGTPEKDKRHILYDAAHDVMVNRTEVVKEVLSWLDQYLGPSPVESLRRDHLAGQSLVAGRVNGGSADYGLVGTRQLGSAIDGAGSNSRKCGSPVPDCLDGPATLQHQQRRADHELPYNRGILEPRLLALAGRPLFGRRLIEG